MRFWKIIVNVCLIYVFCLGSMVANAENIELTKQFVSDWRAGKVTVGGMSNVDSKNLKYDDDRMTVYVQPMFNFQTVWDLGGVRKLVNSMYDNTIYVVDQKMFGGTAGILACTGAEMTVTNKTNEVMVIDLNKSAISIGTYYGRPITAGVKYADMQTANLAPMLIPPKATVKQVWNRGDYTFISSGSNSRWEHPNDLAVNENIFGSGAFILAVGADAKYISMNFNMVISPAGLSQYMRVNKKK